MSLSKPGLVYATLLGILSVVVIFSLTRPAPKKCGLEEVPQVMDLMRVYTCRQSKMALAFGLCEHEPAIIPSTGDMDIVGAPGLGVEACLEKWSPIINNCQDEPDRQLKLVCR